MVNILFISDSTTAAALKEGLQQVLTIKVELATDFDQGLKEVFEKRPVIVCIQDLIDGVTGDSVAQHIKLLLGNKAPNFVLMCHGQQGLQADPKLFNHYLDLDVAYDAVYQELGAAVRRLLGEQWTAVYSPTSGSSLYMYDPDCDDDISTSQEEKDKKESQLTDSGEASLQMPVDQDESEVSFAGLLSQDEAVNTTSGQQTVAAVQENQKFGRVKKAYGSSEEHSSLSGNQVDNLLTDFEENYRSGRAGIKKSVILAVVFVLLAGGGWYSVQKRHITAGENSVNGLHASVPEESRQLKYSVALQPSVQLPSLPKSIKDFSFLRTATADVNYSKSQPGWRRYLTSSRDYRLFDQAGSLLAVQVIVIGSGAITEQELTKIFSEVVGGTGYRISKSEQRGGLYVEHGQFTNGSELLLYRSKAGDSIKAAVIAPKQRSIQ